MTNVTVLNVLVDDPCQPEKTNRDFFSTKLLGDNAETDMLVPLSNHCVDLSTWPPFGSTLSRNWVFQVAVTVLGAFIATVPIKELLV